MKRTHQDPGFIDLAGNKSGEAATHAIPADWRRQGLPAGRRRCSRFPLIESPCVLPDRPFEGFRLGWSSGPNRTHG